MTLSGAGCFVGWYDLTAGDENEHDNWHTHEHMIERVAIPGFLRGSRYRAIDGAPRVCIVYQGETLATFTSDAYLERLNSMVHALPAVLRRYEPQPVYGRGDVRAWHRRIPADASVFRARW